MDLRSQAVSMWLRRWWILGGAIVVGALVYAFSSLLLPDQYAASTTVRVVETGGADSSPQSETVAYYGQTVVGVARTAQALDLVVARSGLPLTRDEAAAQTEVTESTTPGFLTVTARAARAEDAARLADATTATLAERVTEDNETAVQASTAPLQAQIRQVAGQLATLPPTAPERAGVQQRYSSLIDAVTRLESGGSPQLLVGTSAMVPDRPESPTPRRDAALGFLVALVLLAEGVVVLRALRGRLDERHPATEASRLTGLPGVEVRSRDNAAAVLAPLQRDHLPHEGRILVVQLGRASDHDVAHTLQTSAALVATGVSRGAGDGAYGPPASVPRVQAVRGRRVDQAVLEAVRRAEGPIVLAIDTALTGRRALEEGLAALGAVGATVLGVIVWRGRFPRERAARSTTPPSRPDTPPAAGPAPDGAAPAGGTPRSGGSGRSGGSSDPSAVSSGARSSSLS